MIQWVYSGLVSAAVVATFVAVARAKLPAALSPVVVTAFAVAVVLVATNSTVVRFETLTTPLRWLLGPAIVALGAVVRVNRAALRAQGLPMVFAVVVGTTCGVLSAWLLARGLGLGPRLTAATLTRTVTTPFAILVQTRTGGPVTLAAAFAVGTGVIGAILLPPLLKLCRIHGSATVGTAVGVASHIVGTDAVGRRDSTAGAFAGVSMVLAGILVALVLPLAWKYLSG